MGRPKGQSESLAASKQAQEMAAREFELKNKIYQQISPLATSLMGLGISPEDFMKSSLGQAILGQQRAGISNEFDAARMNLTEGLGASGFTGSGVGVGPMANLFGQEAMMNANLIQQLPLTGLNLGMQGANILQGQQAMLNPLGFQSAAIGGYTNIPQGQWGKNILGAVGSALGGMNFTGGGGGGGWFQPPNEPIAG